MNTPQNDMHRYDDIIHLLHHVSSTRPQMPRADRAAQFSPFAALVGYEDAISETVRLTGDRIALDDAALSLLDRKMQILQDDLGNNPAVSFTYFLPDDRKAGGKYVIVAGTVKWIDILQRNLA